MDAAKWERICTRNGFVVKPPINTRHGRVLIAERHFAYAVPEFGWPHVQTIWAFDRQNVEIAQKLYFGWAEATPPQRAEAAVKAATQWVEDNLTVGRYR